MAQRPQAKGMLYGEITEAIIGSAFDVMNELGSGFVESVYERSMVIALRQKGLRVVAQHRVSIFFRSECVGDFYADLLVENKVLVELKAVKDLTSVHAAQTINYLNGTGIEVGLLINFGKPRVEHRRLTRRHDHQRRSQTRQEESAHG